MLLILKRRKKKKLSNEFQIQTPAIPPYNLLFLLGKCEEEKTENIN